ncbi:NifU family protein [Flavobacterium tegetincola]|uniref:NifU family protein n=1 Tax=Flavobacterium tegetincola TaxID=150172 RepID=UPI00040D9FE0|nr:NifU family protein [Flavobacterium tegetincola]
MINVIIRETQNPVILKFEFPDFIANHVSYEFKNIDDATASPLAQKLFHLPFVKAVYISGNFIAIERYNIVEWDDVKDAVAEQINDFVNTGGIVLNAPEQASQKMPATVYGETTPNPSVLKFVVSRGLTKTALEFKNIDDTAASPLAKELFKFPFVKEIFIDENYVSVTKYDVSEWSEIQLELRTFIKEFIENGGTAVDESKIVSHPKVEKQKLDDFDNLDTTSQKIINILEEYVKPAVAADGGNILFDSYDPIEKRVKVVLQGACNGCPSSTFTLKSGIENMLKDMLKDEEIKVEAING